MRFVTVDQTTKFQGITDIQGMKIDRYSLACLGDNSGLTLGNLMDLDIEDDVAKLRQEFGGIWGIFHLVALVTFVSPYAWFLIYHWSLAQFSSEPDGMTLLEAFTRYVVTGGNAWHEPLNLSNINWISLGSFFVYAIYNIVRGCLLWRSKRLETEQEVKGLPVKFILKDNPGWGM